LSEKLPWKLKGLHVFVLREYGIGNVEGLLIGHTGIVLISPISFINEPVDEGRMGVVEVLRGKVFGGQKRG
jgi:hypothetical protein